MRKLTTVIALVAWGSQVMATNGNFFEKVDTFLGQYVQDGLVDYAGIKANEAQLESLTRMIAEFDLEGSSESEKIAFLINAYNLSVIKGIVEGYPVKGPMKINNFFDKKQYVVAGNTLSLNQIEKGALFGIKKDARFHFVLVCAALSCPRLASFAYTPDQLERQLEEVTRAALNDPSFIRFDGKKLAVSQIFSWYESDFKTKKQSVVDYVNRYLENPVPEKTKVTYYTYDWTLNDKNTNHQ